MKMISKSLEDTKDFAKTFLDELNPSRVVLDQKATVVCLHGDLGSGKTTFTQAVGEILGIKEDITSPTFVIMKNYKLQANSYKLLIHIDAYRLNSSRELFVLDWDKTISDSNNIIFIEWPERVEDILPENRIKINFKFVSENEREISMRE